MKAKGKMSTAMSLSMGLMCVSLQCLDLYENILTFISRACYLNGTKMMLLQTEVMPIARERSFSFS